MKNTVTCLVNTTETSTYTPGINNKSTLKKIIKSNILIKLKIYRFIWVFIFERWILKKNAVYFSIWPYDLKRLLNLFKQTYLYNSSHRHKISITNYRFCKIENI